MSQRHSAFALLAAALVLAAAAQVAVAHGPRHNPARHHHFMRHGLPTAYQGLANSLEVTADNLASGQRLYDEHCALCHGATGQGDGEGAADLDPAPPSLAGMFDTPMPAMEQAGSGSHMMQGTMSHQGGMSPGEAGGGLNMDAYSFWAVTEGGAPLGTDMPAFAEVLTEEERWQVLLYIANGFSSDAPN